MSRKPKSPAAAGEPKRKGRPPDVRGKRVNVYLDAASLERADRLGGGNVSNGIRVALARA